MMLKNIPAVTDMNTDPSEKHTFDIEFKRAIDLSSLSVTAHAFTSRLV